MKASTFEAFLEAVIPYKSKLPVVLNEIGDTWIMGIASDPRKMADYRVIARGMKQCFLSGTVRGKI